MPPPPPLQSAHRSAVSAVSVPGFRRTGSGGIRGYPRSPVSSDVLANSPFWPLSVVIRRGRFPVSVGGFPARFRTPEHLRQTGLQKTGPWAGASKRGQGSVTKTRCRATRGSPCFWTALRHLPENPRARAKTAADYGGDDDDCDDGDHGDDGGGGSRSRE